MINLALLLLSICSVESNLDSLAFSYRDGSGIDNHSFGLCQVTYRTARDMGMPEELGCLADYRPRYLRSPDACSLFGVEVNRKYAGKYLLKQLRRYNGDIRKAVSAYNAGHPIKGNVKYVDRVVNRYNKRNTQ